jgi:Ca-activated chloride channel homolog
LSDIKKVYKRSSIYFYLKILIVFFILLNFIIILANPNISNTSESVTKDGIDIVVALDVSLSMEAEDLKPNRIESAKLVINNFIEKQQTNRV